LGTEKCCTWYHANERQPHSANIADELRATQTKWSLPEPMATTDNAANEQKAYEILGWDSFGCYGHKINLVVKKMPFT